MDMNEPTSQPPQSSPPPPRPSEGKPSGVSGRATGVRAASQEGARRYPKPPSLGMRLVLLCLRPETWAEMARYPTRFVLVPLALMILLAGVGIGIGEMLSLRGAVLAFADRYDQAFPALELSADGVLTSTKPLENPIRFDHLSSTGVTTTVLVDPSGKTTPESVKGATLLVTNKEVMLLMSSEQGGPFWRLPLSKLVEGTGKAQQITGAVIRSEVEGNTAGIVAGVMASGALVVVMNAFWAALTIFLISPIVTLAAAGMKVGEGADRRLLLPARASYRIAAAVLVPLVALDGVLHGTGHAISGVLGGEGAWLFWCFSAALLAGWSGLMAKKLYGPKEAVRAGRK